MKIDDGVLTGVVNSDIIGGTLVIPAGVTEIGQNAFRNCVRLIEIEIPHGVRVIGEGAFGYCSRLQKVTIAETVYEIGSFAFSNCSRLTEVVIPDKVNSIGDGTFYGCTMLARIIVGEKNGDFASADGVLYNKNKTEILAVALGADGHIKLPETLTAIPDCAFKGCEKLKAIDIPVSVKTVGWLAFNDCEQLTINCKAKSQPAGFESHWNPQNRPVVWGVK